MTGVDDALDRLENLPHVVEGTLVGIPPDAKHADDCFGCIAMECVAMVRAALERHREENARLVDALDGMARAPYGEYAKAHERAEAAEAAKDTLLREIAEDYVLAGAYHEQIDRARTAEAEVRRLTDENKVLRTTSGWAEARRLTEGLRRELEYGKFGSHTKSNLRALLADSPPDAHETKWLTTVTKPDDSIVDATGGSGNAP